MTTDFDEIYDSSDETVITTCPLCGRPITFSNDAGNGFCIECTRSEDTDL